MKPIFQTKFGGSDAPEAEQGDCIRACLASIFEISLAEAPDFAGEINNGKWFLHLERWLAERNLELIILPLAALAAPPLYAPYLEGRKSTTLSVPSDGHVVVCVNGTVVHDPNPKAQALGDTEEFWFFVCRNPARQPIIDDHTPVKVHP